MNKGLKYFLQGALVAYCAHGLIILYAGGVLNSPTTMDIKKHEVTKEVIYIKNFSNEYSSLISKETKEKLEAKEKDLMNELSSLEEKLAPIEAKRLEAKKRARNPLRYFYQD